jgi:hypothetical protein
MTGVSSIPAIIAVIVIIKTNRIIRSFRDAGAIDAMHAVSPDELNVGKRLVFHKLVRRRVLVDVGGDRYFLDEEKALRYKRIRALIILIFLVMVLVADFLLLHY